MKPPLYQKAFDAYVRGELQSLKRAPVRRPESDYEQNLYERSMLMENPAGWTEVERTIDAALTQYEKDNDIGVYGLSLVRTISDALRAKNLLNEEQK